MHISSGRWVQGLLLALLTAFLWGILPIKLKQVLQVMDPVTVTWYRLSVSGACCSRGWRPIGDCRRSADSASRARGWWPSR
ncbi:EamA-like transporter family protein [Pseudomonas sp. 2848]|nr:EamA-like transporter family protein [Pseudomonas sp. 2848]